MVYTKIPRNPRFVSRRVLVSLRAWPKTGPPVKISKSLSHAFVKKCAWEHGRFSAWSSAVSREALLNAFRHSEARRVEIDLEYAPRQLRIAVRDNGKGITPESLRSGVGHRGLSGIRDVAERMGAKLKLSSRAEAGTEVEL